MTRDQLSCPYSIYFTALATAVCLLMTCAPLLVMAQIMAELNRNTA